MNILAMWSMFIFSFKILSAQLNEFPKMLIMVLLFLKINSFSWSTFSSVLLINKCHKHLESSTEVTLLFNFETQSKTAFFKVSAYQTLLSAYCNTPLWIGIISLIYQLIHTYSWIYLYIYVYIIIYQMSPNCFGASWGRNLDTCSKLYIWLL
jgi:hypothetical protein